MTETKTLLSMILFRVWTFRAVVYITIYRNQVTRCNYNSGVKILCWCCQALRGSWEICAEMEQHKKKKNSLAYQGKVYISLL